MSTLVEEFPPPEGELQPAFAVRRATPGYFEAMGIPLLEGRTFTPDDHNRRLESVIISRSVKDKYWPHTSALGKRVNPWGVRAQVVGVVGDVHDTGLDVPADQFAYLPMLDDEEVPNAPLSMTVTVRTAVEPLSLVSAVRATVAEFDADVAMAIPTDARRARRFDEPYELHGVRADDRGTRRAVLGSRRHLRRAVVRRGAAHAGDRDSLRAGGPAPCCAWSSRRAWESRVSGC